MDTVLLNSLQIGDYVNVTPNASWSKHIEVPKGPVRVERLYKPNGALHHIGVNIFQASYYAVYLDEITISLWE